MELVPLVVFGLYGGALADAVDRRRMVQLTEVAFLVLSAVLMVNALLPSPQLWPLYAFAFVAAALDGLQRPSLDAICRASWRTTSSSRPARSWGFSSSLATMAGPALGGMLIAAVGVWAGTASTCHLRRLDRRAHDDAPGPAVLAGRDASMRAIGEGLSYAWSRKDLLGTYLVDLSAMFFAFPYALFPFVADALDSQWALGLLYSAGSRVARSPPPPAAGPGTCTTTAGRSCTPPRCGARPSPRSASRTTSGSRWRCSRSRGPATWSAGSSAS